MSHPPSSQDMPLRIFHFSGGLRGICSDGSSITLKPTMNNAGNITRIIKDYSAFHEVREFGRILGVEFYYHQGHFDREYPPVWRTFHYNNGWICNELIQLTAQIRYHAGCQRKYTIAKSAYKITSWISATSRSIKNLSNAYNACLIDKCKQVNFENEEAFSDNFEDDIFDCIHNTLYYLGTLRDHIAEFIIMCLMKNVPRFLMKEPKMSKLIRFIMEQGNVREYLPTSISDEIIFASQDEENGNAVGWLNALAAYRNTITHDGPIQYMRDRLWVWQEVGRSNDELYPRIKFPIPKYPFDKNSNAPEDDSNIESYIQSQAPNKEFFRVCPDGLDVVFELFEKLLILARHAVDLSPINPEPIVLTPSNLIINDSV